MTCKTNLKKPILLDSQKDLINLIISLKEKLNENELIIYCLENVNKESKSLEIVLKDKIKVLEESVKDISNFKFLETKYSNLKSLDDIKNSYENSKKEIDEMNFKKDMISTKYNTLKEKYVALTNEYVTFEENLKVKISILKKENGDLENKYSELKTLDDIKNIYETTHENVLNLNKQNNDLKIEIEKRFVDLKTLNDLQSLTQQNIERIKNQKSDLEIENADLETRYANLKTLNDIELSKEVAKKDIDVLYQQISELKNEYNVIKNSFINNY